eukprot:16444168-Heterocapsa_arctica.AAC.1
MQPVYSDKSGGEALLQAPLCDHLQYILLCLFVHRPSWLYDVDVLLMFSVPLTVAAYLKNSVHAMTGEFSAEEELGDLATSVAPTGLLCSRGA